MRLAAAIEVPARWLRYRCDGPHGLGWAAIAVGGYSGVTTLGILLRVPIPEIEPSLDWARHMGVTMGIFGSLGFGFLFWFYLAVGTRLTLVALRHTVSLAKITRMVGLSFVFPLLGMSVLVIFGQDRTPPVVSGGLQLAAAMWGLAILARAISVAVRVPWRDAAVALIIPIIAAELLLLVMRLAWPPALEPTLQMGELAGIVQAAGAPVVWRCPPGRGRGHSGFDPDWSRNPRQRVCQIAIGGQFGHRNRLPHRPGTPASVFVRAGSVHVVQARYH